MKKLFGFFLILFCTLGVLSAQITPEELQQQLEEKGLEEDDVMKKLEEKGIDIDNIDPNNVAEVEQALEETIKELEAEKAAQSGNTTTPGTPVAPIDTTAIPGENEKPDTAPAEKTEAKETKTAAGEDKSKEAKKAEKESSTLKEGLPKSNIYGHNIFREQADNFSMEAKDVKAPDSYVLGADDEVSVSIFGNSQASYNFPISLDGYIQPPAMGRIYLKGLTLGQARELLRRRFAQYYSFGPGEFEVAVTYSRVISINIVGEVFQTGSYTIPATNTAFNALIAAGGPTDIGSVRKIRLMRNGEAPRIFDVYEFLKDPSVEGNFYLQENDYIHVPIYEKLVTVDGAVRKPFKYELLGDENLKDLIQYAGGFKENAYQGNIQITRYINDEEQILDVDFRDLMASGDDFELFSGDIVEVSTIAKPYENFVEIVGTVEFPGRFSLATGMTVEDLVDQGRLLEESRRDVAYLFRTKPDETVRLIRIDLASALDDPSSLANLRLEPKDKLQIFSLVSFVDKASLATSGAVRNPVSISYDPEENVKVSDMIVLSGGLLPNAAQYGYIKRVDQSNKKNVDYIRVNLFEVIADTTSADNRALKPNDELVVYTNEQFADQANVVVAGAVRTPGEFEYDDGLRVSDIVYFSDGLKPEATDFAYINRLNLETQEVEYIRVNLKEAMENPGSNENLVLKPFDKLNVMSKTTFIDETTVDVTGSVRVPGSYQYDETLTLTDALTMAGGLKFGAASNRVEVSRVIITNNQPTRTVVAILEVDENMVPTSGGADFQLQPYDQIIVRNVPEFKLQENITIEGEVKYPGQHPLLSDNERLSSLIDRAGGLTEEAFPEGATLYRAKDGVGYIIMDLKNALKSEKSRYNFILKAGDLISVPAKKDFVTLTGATKASELYNQEILKDGKVAVPFHKGKRARFYVNKYTAGIGKDGKASKITVVHPNGEVKKTKNFGLFLIYPKVQKGSQVNVGLKPKEEKKDDPESQKEEIDWGKVVADSVAQATAILSLILLIQKVN